MRSSVYLTAVLVSTELWNLTCISLWNWRSSYLVDTLAIGHDDHDGGHDDDDDDCECDHNQDNDKQPCIISDDPVIL